MVVAKHESGRADVVEHYAEGLGHLLALAVLSACKLLYLFNGIFKNIRLVNAVYAVEYAQRALKSHTGIDVALL